MCLIMILAPRYSGATALARRVSEILGYRYIDNATILEKAGNWGAAPAALRGALDRNSGPIGAFLQKRRLTAACCALVQAALADEVAIGPAVYCGRFAYLLPNEISPVLRVQVIEPVEFRVREVQRRFGLTAKAAERHVRNTDRNQQKWIRDAHAFAETESPVPSLVINLANIDAMAACDAIVTAAEQRHWRERPRTASAEEIAAESRVRAMLALDARTARLKVRVETRGGAVRIGVGGHISQDLNAVRDVVAGIPGISRFGLVCEDRQTALSTMFGVRGVRYDSTWFNPVRLRSLGFAALSVAAVCVALIWGLPRIGTRWGRTQTLIGVVTDTKCVGKHQGTPESVRQCVKTCVRSGSDVRYALYDGATTYDLSDQRLPEAFAGQRVKVTGVVNTSTRAVKLASIVPAS